ncbi:MAG: SDR family oxidoreductase [Gammaproteobacteria bacterium]|nr:SDR family oxidoreductase [Gammaproteobacteria bacterium]
MTDSKADTILITGASSGLGRGMAREFAARGCHLALCARRTERLEALRDELADKHGVRVELRALDVNDHERVFEVFRDFARSLGRLDRVVVNAGVGDGRRIGTGRFEHNRKVVETNLVAALAQCEAAVEIFREQKHGHLVLVSSMSAVRGLPGHMTAYAASKAGLAHLGEGIRAELMGTPIRVTTLLPGFIRTELNEDAGKMPFEVDEVTGSRAMVRAIERAPATACVPGWPWRPIGWLMKILPLRVIAKAG